MEYAGQRKEGAGRIGLLALVRVVSRGTKLDLPSWTREMMARKMVTGEVIQHPDGRPLWPCCSARIKFPEDCTKTAGPLEIQAVMQDFSGPLLKDSTDVSLQEVSRLRLCKMLVKTMNRQKLNQRADSIEKTLRPSSSLQALVEGAIQVPTL